jgi:hypothetical protein
MRELCLTLMFVVVAPGVIVDRIAITVGPRVITASEIDLRIRLTAFENGVEPVFDSAARKLAAEQLIDQKLVEREMDIGHYPRTGTGPLASDPRTSDPVALSRALLLRGLTVADLQEDLARQAGLLNFLSLRFRPAGIDGNRTDAEMEAWLSEQRKRIRIEYLDKDLAP